MESKEKLTPEEIRLLRCAYSIPPESAEEIGEKYFAMYLGLQELFNGVKVQSKGETENETL